MCLKEIEPKKEVKNVMSSREQETKDAIDIILDDPRNQCGIVVIDDFHLLDKERQKKLADLLKLCADEGRTDLKLVLIGINNAGQNLVDMTPDLNGRIDTIKFERNASDKIRELIRKGEKALNIEIPNKEEIIHRSYGSFHVTQMLCKSCCIADNVLGYQDIHYCVKSSISQVIADKIVELGRLYKTGAQVFAKGNKFRRNGNLPYFHLLQWLSETEDGTIYINELIQKYPQYKYSLNQISEKGHIEKLLDMQHITLEKYLYYDVNSKMLAIYDPKFLFYLKNLNWDDFAKELGIAFNRKSEQQYEVALSFAGEKREFAKAIFNMLVENEVSVFYDNDASSEMLGKDLKEYFEPIYKSDAKYVIVLMDEFYSNKVWTLFESESYRKKWDENAVIPVIFDNYQPSVNDKLYSIGYKRMYTDSDINQQVQQFVSELILKL